MTIYNNISNHLHNTHTLRNLSLIVVRLLREELALLQEPGSHIGEVLKVMGKNKVLVKVNPDGKYVVEVDKKINIADCTPNTRVALRNDSYMLHKILPNKVCVCVISSNQCCQPFTFGFVFTGRSVSWFDESRKSTRLHLRHGWRFSKTNQRNQRSIVIFRRCFFFFNSFFEKNFSF